jgi:hypothetical protein
VKRAKLDFATTFAWIAGGVTAVLAIATAIECHQYTTSTFPNASWAPSLIYGAVLWFWWAAIGAGLWMSAQRWPKMWIISLKNAVLQLVLAACVAAAHLKILQATIHEMIAHWPYLHEIGYEQIVAFGIQRISLEGLLYMILWAICAALGMQVARQHEALQLAELKQQLSSAHLRALQMQLKPHFLFNTLNAITTLVELGRQKEAVKTLSHLNAILRSTLAQQVPEKVPVAEELAVVENYLAIEQIRFADRLRVEMRVDPEALDGLVPCFLLQPIIENAIRHGVSQLEDAGIVRTAIERADGELHISVQDNGPGLKVKSNSKGHGVGLRSIDDRLAHFYPEHYEFSTGELETGGFEVSIKIPYERAQA